MYAIGVQKSDEVALIYSSFLIKLTRPVSVPQLKSLLILHLTPIKQFVLLWPIAKKIFAESTHLEMGFLLRCFQQLSTPHMATQRLLLAE